MSRYDDLLQSIKSKTADVSIIGMGYIGLPTALFYAMRGLKVRGIDTNQALIDGLKKGIIPIHEEGLGDIAEKYLSKIQLATSYDDVGESDVFVLCLPSPVDESGKTVIKYLEHAVRDIAKISKKGCLILVESTVPVGTTIHLAKLFADESGLKPDSDFWFAHCPERVLPGKVVEEMDTNHRLAGGTSDASAELAVAFLTQVFKAELVHTTSASVSEAAKLAENAFRDTNIAYANELAKLCATMAIDVSEVIKLANLHPRVQILNPGLGVGGYCLPKDGWILVESARKMGGSAELIPAARHVNDSMPWHVSKRIREEVLDCTDKATVGLLGLSFKENVSDTRNSPTIELLQALTSTDVDVIVYDPLVDEGFGAKQADSLEDLLKVSDIIVLCVGHDQIIKELETLSLAEKVFVDPRSLLPKMRDKVKKYVGLSV
ncbi:MAG: nucleotide sugar dehydrogenase [Candidatus Thorarchaeota archaeon]